MSTFNIAFVTPVNDAEASTRLSLDEVWQGCEFLALSPELFTSAIASSDWKTGEEGKILQTLQFQGGTMPDMRQEIVLKDKHSFQSTNLDWGNRVITTIYYGASDSEDDLHLSLEYNIPYGQIDPKADEGEAMRRKYSAKGRQSLDDGIKRMRELKAEGKIR